MIFVGVFLLLCATCGGLIGRSKGIGSLGFILGGVLGPFGVVITLVMKGDPLCRIQTRSAEQGWHRDPLGRFDARWFDGRHWTQHVQRVDNEGRRENFEDLL